MPLEWARARARAKNLKLFGTIRPDAGPNEYGPHVTALAKLKLHRRARTHTGTRAQDILK